jgi:hypothetical protein
LSRTFNPIEPSLRAISFPIPREAPVMIATLPEVDMFISFVTVVGGGCGKVSGQPKN